MAVQRKSNYLRNTTGGAFSSQRQGGTLYGNGATGSVITKAFLVKDAVDNIVKPYGVVLKAYPGTSGMYGTQKIVSGGAFAYFEAGKYIIRTISTTIAGVASTKLLIPGSDNGKRNAIHQFIHDFGARLLTKWRANEFSWLGVFDNGNKIKRRYNWVDAAGTAASKPVTLTNLDMLNPVGGSTARKSDSAANPTRAIPGELVMKVDFVTTNISSGGDFFNYKPITGM